MARAMVVMMYQVAMNRAIISGIDIFVKGDLDFDRVF